MNRFNELNEAEPEVFPIDPMQQLKQAERVKRLKATRNQEPVERALDDLRQAAVEGTNLMYPMKEALRVYATLGEVSDVLREVYGVYVPG